MSGFSCAEILRRMKSGVMTELPEKTETVLLSEMEKESRRRYASCSRQNPGLRISYSAVGRTPEIS